MFNCFKNIYENQNKKKRKGLLFEAKKLKSSSELKNYILETSKKVYEISKGKY